MSIIIICIYHIIVIGDEISLHILHLYANQAMHLLIDVALGKRKMEEKIKREKERNKDGEIEIEKERYRDGEIEI